MKSECLRAVKFFAASAASASSFHFRFRRMSGSSYFISASAASASSFHFRFCNLGCLEAVNFLPLPLPASTFAASTLVKMVQLQPQNVYLCLFINNFLITTIRIKKNFLFFDRGFYQLCERDKKMYYRTEGGIPQRGRLLIK